MDTTHVLVDGLGDRQGLYVGMSRGREANYAYCVTGFPRMADVREGSRPAPELERARRLMRERAGLPPDPVPARNPEEHQPQRDPVSVLTEVLGRDGAALSATETLRDELSNADHLGRPRARSGTTRPAARRPSGSSGPCARTSRQQTPTPLSATRRAPGCGGRCARPRPQGWTPVRCSSPPWHRARSTGARYPARVIDARVRRMLEHTVPQPPATWSQRVPEMGDPDLDRYMTELAAAMDDRVRRIGEHAAQTRPAWATQALGDVPENPAGRAEWEDRASKLGAYRELYGYDAQDDAIGPEPGKTSPEARADWHAAFTALGRVDGIDLRGCSDGQLRLRRAMYERETSWAPRHVGEELRLARMQARTAWENAIREEHETRAATDPDAAARHEALAGMWRAMEAKATRVADLLAETQETRRQWEALTEPTRRVAVAADLELRRRHPGMVLEPLRSAEPAGIPGRDPCPPRLARTCGSRRPSTVLSTWRGRRRRTPRRPVKAPLTPAQREARGQQALGLTPQTVHDEVPEQVHRIRENARKAQEEIDKLRGTPSSPRTMTPSTSAPRGETWPAATATPSSSHPSPTSCPPAQSSSEYKNAARSGKPSMPDPSVIRL